MSGAQTSNPANSRLPELTVYALNGIVPVVDPTTFVHPTAVLIGDVIVGPNCYIGPNASLRGDFGRLVVGPGVNIQDSCTIHGSCNEDTILEKDAHIGHGAVIHACTVRQNVLVGMNATVLDRAEIGESAIVAANAFVKAGDTVPPRSLVAGIPARVIRELTEKDLANKKNGTSIYHQLVGRCHETMTECAPLAAEEPDRQRMKFADTGHYIEPD